MKNTGKIKRIVYVPIVADLFHYGHLQILEYSKKIGDYTVCGLLTDEGVLTYRQPAITNFKERKAVLSSLKLVDQIMEQQSKDSTPNLKKLHNQFKGCQLILLHGDDWSNIPGSEFIKEVGGQIARPPYYQRLSTQKIIKEITDKYKDEEFKFELFSELFRIKDIIQYGKHACDHIISTKADTLKALEPLLKKSKIEKMLIFKVADWKNNKTGIIKKIKEQFSGTAIIVRSSALNEDTFDHSLAGYFLSALNISPENAKKLEKTIGRVVDSYSFKDCFNSENQILVQKQTRNIKISGVLFTKKSDNSPYYIINFDDHSGLTDTVTSGIENKTIQIRKGSDLHGLLPEWRNLIIAIKEIEDIIPGNFALDIEFAITTTLEIVIFQVRPLVRKDPVEVSQEQVGALVNQLKAKFIELSRPNDKVAGKKNYFSNMAFWNPSEIIGEDPNYLDYSLYSYLIMDFEWLSGIVALGYQEISPARLMVRFGNKPYIDLRSAFNALFIETIPKAVQAKLINYFFDKLKRNPQLHDKIEFQIHYTCLDLSFKERSKELAGRLTPGELSILEMELKKFTNTILRDYKEILAGDIENIETLIENRKRALSSGSKTAVEEARVVKTILADCKKYGTEPFARVARLAFIANTILKSLVKQNVITTKFYDDFLGSIETVAGEISVDFNKLKSKKLSKNVFLKKYGHLRPGTYDITAKRYDRNPELFRNLMANTHRLTRSKFVINRGIQKAVTTQLARAGLEIDADGLWEFVKKTTQLREYLKFEFTKNLSQALEIIASTGGSFGICREDMAFVDIHSFLRLSENENQENLVNVWKNLIPARKNERKLFNYVSLPPLIFGGADFDIISHFEAQPNFVTQKTIKGRTIYLGPKNSATHQSLKGKIVIIEKADPGFDWIFSRGISGLITEYGGVASHMAIRCAEFGIPAAIGCGAGIFNKVKSKINVILDCNNRKVLY